MNDAHDNAETDADMGELIRLRDAINCEGCAVSGSQVSTCPPHRPCGLCRLNRRVEYYRIAFDTYRDAMNAFVTDAISVVRRSEP